MRLSRRLFLLVTCFVVVPFLLAELALRVVTSTTEVGMLRVGSLTLLPLVPTKKMFDDWWERTQRPNFIVLDADLGWAVKTQGREPNSQGIRTDIARQFSAELPGDRTRIVAVGDSFMYGTGVKLEDCWSYHINSTRPAIEALNFGVPGYGVDQAFLRWRRDGKRFRAHLVLLGIWPDNIFRNHSLVPFYRTFGGSDFRVRPRFKLVGEKLVLIPPPFGRERMFSILNSPKDAKVLEDDVFFSEELVADRWYYGSRTLRVLETIHRRFQRRQFYRRLYSGKDERALRLTTAIVKEFAKEVRAQGSTPVVVIFPDRKLFDRYAERDSFPLTRRLRELDLRVMDLMPLFANLARREGEEKYFGPVHLSPLGNRIFAEEVIQLVETL